LALAFLPINMAFLLESLGTILSLMEAYTMVIVVFLLVRILVGALVRLLVDSPLDSHTDVMMLKILCWPRRLTKRLAARIATT